VGDRKGMLVFTRTREECHRLRLVIEAMGDCRVADLSADMKKRERAKIIEDFDSGAYDVLVSTAVLCRGVDLKNVRHVVMYALPQTAEEYVHMVGRTARAYQKGTSVAMIGSSERGRLDKMLKAKVANSKLKTIEWSTAEMQEYHEKYQQCLTKVKQAIEASHGFPHK